MGLTNNDILKKLRVAHKLRDEEIVDILKLVDFRMSKSELGAFFRNENHPKYMDCGDQVLRNFLNGLVIHLRGPMEKSLRLNLSNRAIELNIPVLLFSLPCGNASLRRQILNVTLL